jgi:phage tail-like protein
MTTGTKPYPYTSFRFRVEIGGIIVAQVSDITGLILETETESYEEGGVNDYVHILPKRTKYQNITLKRGISDLDDMWKWYQEVVSGKFKRKSGIIVLQDVTGADKWRWNFHEAFPVKWTGPELKADSNTVAFETIELAHHGIKKG